MPDLLLCVLDGRNGATDAGRQRESRGRPAVLEVTLDSSLIRSSLPAGEELRVYFLNFWDSEMELFSRISFENLNRNIK